MDDSVQNIVFPSKKNPFATVTALSKILALALFVSLPFIGFYLGTRYQRAITTLVTIVATAPKETESTVQQDTGSLLRSEPRMLMEKKIDGNTIAAYRPSGEDSYLIFYVSLNGGRKIFSISTDAFMEDGLFEIVGDEIWLVNGQTNKIDVYTRSLDYKESIDLPKFDIGTIYAIKCDSEVCSISSAYHQQAGCQTKLNLETLQYSIPECFGRGVSSTPQTY